MKSLFPHCLIILMLAIIPISSKAQDIFIIDTSADDDLLIEPTIAMTEGTVGPDCHTYTGCGLIVVKKYTYHKPKVYKHKRARIHRPSCCFNECYIRPVTRACY